MAKTQRERDAEAREAKLDRIKTQVEDGSLKIRKMSEKERTAWAKSRDEREASATTPAEKKKVAAAQRRRARKAEQQS